MLFDLVRASSHQPGTTLQHQLNPDLLQDLCLPLRTLLRLLRLLLVVMSQSRR